MANKNYITYYPPKDRFVMVSNIIVEKYDAEVIGVYCKIVKLSSGKSLSIDFISKRIKVNDKKLRRIVVLLESEGYIVREPIRDEKGYMRGWNYRLYAEPVPLSERSHAGKKMNDDQSVLPKIGQDGKSVKTENGQDNILDNNELSNNKNLDYNKRKVLSEESTKSTRKKELTEEEKEYQEKMREKFPRIMKMEQPLTLEQARKLKEKYSSDMLKQIMYEMENWKPLLKKSVSAYRTIINWCNREKDRA